MTEDSYPPDDDLGADQVVESPQPDYADGGVDIPWRLGLLLALAVLLVVFAVQNTQDAELRLFGWAWQLPLVIIIAVTGAISALGGYIVGSLIKRRQIKRVRERQELRRLRGDA